ncbi:MAG: chromosome partitioning protein ParB [Deltaproteobacteria bacterium]|nr:chromosome partitioning protein ParB [Deltaproteobacteria bacterium]
MSQRRSALGRGLGALISSPAQSAEAPVPGPSGTPAPFGETQISVDTQMRQPDPNVDSQSPQELEIELIDPNPDQPRREFDPLSLEQLSRSIGQHGVLQPVVVRRAAARFELVMGERRFRASQLAGRKTIPVVVLDVDPADRLELAIVENVQRQDLNPIELAYAYQALADAGHTQDEIGRKVAMDRSSVANHIRLLDLSQTIQGDVENGRLSMGHAKALLQVTDVEVRESLRARILSQSLSVRASERAAREVGGTRRRPIREPKLKPPIPALDPDTRAYIEKIERRLQTKVTLHPNTEGGGKLEINYFNLEDLARIGDMLLGESS